MNERLPIHDTPNNEHIPTIELSNHESFQAKPHNTALFEFTGHAASRNHIFFFTATNHGDIAPVYLFRTFDAETYDDVRQHILANLAYKAILADEVDPSSEHAYQQQVDQHVAEWHHNMPQTAIDFLITTAP